MLMRKPQIQCKLWGDTPVVLEVRLENFVTVVELEVGAGLLVAGHLSHEQVGEAIARGDCGGRSVERQSSHSRIGCSARSSARRRSRRRTAYCGGQRSSKRCRDRCRWGSSCTGLPAILRWGPDRTRLRRPRFRPTGWSAVCPPNPLLKKEPMGRLARTLPRVRFGVPVEVKVM